MPPLSGSVECVECNQLLGEVSALSHSELCTLVASLVVACHAAQPHCPHTLRAVLPEIKGATQTLKIRCLHTQCAHIEPFVTECPIELVAALTLVVHTSHEGHPLELAYGDRVWTSPLSKQNPARDRVA